jgi:hypothetical protein
MVTQVRFADFNAWSRLPELPEEEVRPGYVSQVLWRVGSKVSFRLL